MPDESEKAGRFELQAAALKRKCQRDRASREAKRQRHLQQMERDLNKDKETNHGR